MKLSLAERTVPYTDAFVESRQLRRSSLDLEAEELCSLSRTPSIDLEAEEQEKVEIEKRSSKALIEAHGRPCYPIDLAPGIYKDPGPYRDIMLYWDGLGLSSTPISRQGLRWDQFRRFQQRNRKYFVPRNRFPEFRQGLIDRRRRHGLGGDVRLLEDRDNQSDLDHWIEYQDYELAKYELLETDLENAKAALVARRKAVAEAGLTAYEGAQDLDFGGFFKLSLKYGGEEGPSLDRCISARRKLELAESRLEAAKSGNLKDIVEKGRWIRSFQEQVDAAQAQLDAVPKYREEDWLPEGRYYVQEGTNERERMEKTRAACSKRYDAEWVAKGALRLAREGLQAAQADAFGEEIERAALAEMVLAEVQSARAELEEANKIKDQVKLQRRVIGALGSIVHANLMIQKYRVLLGWIEQQRCEMMNGCASTEGTDQLKRGSSRVLRARLKPGNSALNGASKANNRRKMPNKEAPYLKPAGASKVTKLTSKKRGPQRTKLSCSTLQPMSKVNRAPAIVKPRGNEVPKAKTDACPLHSVRSSRISKPRTKGMPGKLRGGTVPQGKNGPLPSPSLSTLKRSTQRPAGMALRRSTRLSRLPERFYPR